MRRIFAAFMFVLMCFASVLVSNASALDVTDSQVTSAIPKTDSPASRSQLLHPTILGVYDPKAALSQSRALTLEHKFVFWQKFDKLALRKDLLDAQKRGRSFMITIEPYTKATNWRDGSDRLFKEIAAGKFDKNIRAICGELSAFDGEVLIRWGHEMEDPTGRYPWARKDPSGYKLAYRHVVDACRIQLPLARFVWSPKGEKNLSDFYPGEDVVDVVGISVWGLQSMDQDYYARDRSFFDALGEKYLRVNHFGKPVYVAELGFSGSPTYRRKWIDQASGIRKLNEQFPLLEGIVFFNDREPHAWPQNYGKPDWRIQPEAVGQIAGSQTASVRTQSLRKIISQVITLLPAGRPEQLAYLPSVVLFLLSPALT